MRSEGMDRPIATHHVVCECGCGLPAPLAQRTDARFGWVKGEPLWFVRGHATRKHDFGYDVDANGCWLFRGYVSPTGYGYIGRKPAYRHYYETYVGPIPHGMQIDHLCRVPTCVNPDHLEPVTSRENTRRGNAGKHPKQALRKLSEEQVRAIRASQKSSRALAKEFGVSAPTINLARSGAQYREVV